MRIKVASFLRKEALDTLLHRLYEELLKEPIVKKAFLIEEELYFEAGNGYKCFNIKEIPIETEHLIIPSEMKLGLGLTKIDKKLTIKERLKILFKGTI